MSELQLLNLARSATVNEVTWFAQLVTINFAMAAALAALKALPSRSFPARQLPGVTESWLGIATAAVFNASFWVLWIGIFHLLFFRRKDGQR